MSETVLLTIIGAQWAAIAGIAVWLRGHESSCTRRWNQLLEEHGEMRADVRNLQLRFGNGVK